jgi:hypothetical protein
MSEIETPEITLIRLLKGNVQVVRDNGSLANVEVSGENPDGEAFRGFDGQVTVGLADTVDQKLELTGKTRKRTSTLRVNVWTVEQAGALEPAKTLHSKLVAEVNRVIRQNRLAPNQTVYSLYGLGAGSQTHQAYVGNAAASPHAGSWLELTSEDYVKLWAPDSNSVTVSRSESGETAALLFGFKPDSRKNVAKKVMVLFVGCGSASSGNYVSVQVWNHVTEAWEHTQSGSADSDQTLAITLTADLPSYIDGEGYVWLLAQTSPSDGQTPSVLHCNYATCTVTVNGATYCDVSGYRDLHRADTKPPIYRTEFTVKSWFFENIGV